MNRTTLPAESGNGKHQQRARAKRFMGASALGVLSAAVATAGLVLPADGAVNARHTVFVLKNDSIVEAEGLAAGENVLVQVKRNGVVAGSAAGPASAGGTFILNHDVCWDRFTPRILPGDVVVVTSRTGVDRVPVADVHVTEGPVLVGDSFTIKGRVAGSRPPVGELQVEARTNDPIRFRPLAPNLNPDAGEVRGQITYDGPTGGAFTATFTGLNAQQQEAVGNFGEFFVTHAPAANEMTMATEGTGAAGPGCPPAADHAVTGLSKRVINRANQGTPLTVSGMTVNATDVSVRLRDPDGTVVTQNAGVTGAGAGQTWRTTFQPAALVNLNGRVTVGARYTSGGVARTGLTMGLLKDTVAPRRPSASPDGGTYSRRQFVSLSADAGTQIRYTVGVRPPRPRVGTGIVYRGRQISVRSSQMLKAIAVDRAGNPSPVTRERYRIGR
jgi:hypothetical protein